MQQTLAHLGASPAELGAAVDSVAQLLQEKVELTDASTKPRYALPK